MTSISTLGFGFYHCSDVCNMFLSSEIHVLLPTRFTASQFFHLVTLTFHPLQLNHSPQHCYLLLPPTLTAPIRIALLITSCISKYLIKISLAANPTSTALAQIKLLKGLPTISKLFTTLPAHMSATPTLPPLFSLIHAHSVSIYANHSSQTT